MSDPGALAAALLFNLGKGLIAWYIGTQALESTYGAAASIVVLLIWVYYTAQIVLFGAEQSAPLREERLALMPLSKAKVTFQSAPLREGRPARCIRCFNPRPCARGDR